MTAANHSRTGLNRAIRNVMMIAVMTAAILCCCMLTCHADTFTDEYGVTWNYTIAVFGDQPLIINGCDKIPESGELRIPEQINGKAPWSISARAFMNNTEIRSVVLPDSITRIQDLAFCGCTNLEELNCPAGLTMIFPQAFQDCTSLKEVKLNSKLDIIYNNAFMGCSSLTSVTIPAGVTSIEPAAFIDCKSLTSINVEEGNSTYSSQDGVLYTSGGADLLMYPAGKTDSIFYVPEGVKTIGADALDSTKVEHVVLPDKVTSIGNNAFSNSSLKDIYIPASVETIDNAAFANTPAGFAIYAEAGSAAADFASNHNIAAVPATLEEYEQAVQEDQGGGTGGGNEAPGGGDQPGGNDGPGGGDQPGGNDQPGSGEGSGTGNTCHTADHTACRTKACSSYCDKSGIESCFNKAEKADSQGEEP